MATGEEPDDITAICITGLETHAVPNPTLPPCDGTLYLPCLKDSENHRMKCQDDQQLVCQSFLNFDLKPECGRLIEDQLKVLEAALVMTREDKCTLQRERQAISDVISSRADTLRALVTQAEERSQRALAEVAERLDNQIQEVLDTACDKYRKIWQLSARGARNEQVQFVSRGKQTILLSDDEFQYYQERCSRKREENMLLHQFDDCAIGLQAVEAFIGTVSDDTDSAREDAHSLVPALVCTERDGAERHDSVVSVSFPSSATTNIAHGVVDTKQKLTTLQTILETAFENDAAMVFNGQEENLTMESEVLKEEYSMIQHSFSSFQQTLKDIKGLKRDMSALQKEFKLIKADYSRLQKDGDAVDCGCSDISSIRQNIASMQQELTSIQNAADNIRKESCFMKAVNLKNQDGIENLSKEFKSFKELSTIMVAFNAEINQDITTNTSLFDPVILNIVTCNAGQAYNEHTGVFIAPVTGTYFFIARAMTREGPGYCHLLITVDGDDVASSLSHEGELHAGVGCTVHVVHRLTPGQKVALLAKGEARLRCYETCFSGALLRPE